MEGAVAEIVRASLFKRQKLRQDLNDIRGLLDLLDQMIRINIRHAIIYPKRPHKSICINSEFLIVII